MAMKRDIVEFDVIKFLLMIFVIAGHLAANNIVEPSRFCVDRILSNAFIGCGMPLFFFMSGYLSYGGFVTRPPRQTFVRLVRIIWPAISSGIFFAVLGCLCGFYSWRDAVAYPYRHFMALWFTQALFIVASIVAAVYWLFKSSKARWIALAVAYLMFLFGPTENRFINLALPMHMFPYFILGVAVKERGVMPWQNRNLATLCGIGFIAVCIFEQDIRHNGMGFYWASTLWQDVLLTWKGISTMIARNVVGVAGIIFSLWVVRGIVAFARGGGGQFGRTSLGVYVFHGWVLMAIGKLPFMPLEWYFKWPVAICVFFMMHYWVVLIRKYKACRFVILGES